VSCLVTTRTASLVVLFKTRILFDSFELTSVTTVVCQYDVRQGRRSQSVHGRRLREWVENAGRRVGACQHTMDWHCTKYLSTSAFFYIHISSCEIISRHDTALTISSSSSSSSSSTSSSFVCSTNAIYKDAWYSTRWTSRSSKSEYPAVTSALTHTHAQAYTQYRLLDYRNT